MHDAGGCASDMRPEHEKHREVHHNVDIWVLALQATTFMYTGMCGQFVAG
jgi:hypothetical protein